MCCQQHMTQTLFLPQSVTSSVLTETLQGIDCRKETGENKLDLYGCFFLFKNPLFSFICKPNYMSAQSLKLYWSYPKGLEN